MVKNESISECSFKYIFIGWILFLYVTSTKFFKYFLHAISEIANHINDIIELFGIETLDERILY